jgi:ferritin
MISDKMQAAINEQINKELYSEYLYVSMAAYFDSIGLKGFANWMRVQVKEERTHALMMYTYVNEAGGRVLLQPIDGPPTEFESALDVYEKTLEHERFVTSRINGLVDLAIAESDHATNAFLQWFVTEQVEEEASAKDIADQLRFVQGDGRGLLMLDREMAARVYTVPAAAATIGPI